MILILNDLRNIIEICNYCSLDFRSYFFPPTLDEPGDAANSVADFRNECNDVDEIMYLIKEI